MLSCWPDRVFCFMEALQLFLSVSVQLLVSTGTHAGLILGLLWLCDLTVLTDEQRANILPLMPDIMSLIPGIHSKRRELTSENCLLTSICVPRHTFTRDMNVCTHTPPTHNRDDDNENNNFPELIWSIRISCLYLGQMPNISSFMTFKTQVNKSNSDVRCHTVNHNTMQGYTNLCLHSKEWWQASTASLYFP